MKNKNNMLSKQVVSVGDIDAKLRQKFAGNAPKYSKSKELAMIKSKYIKELKRPLMTPNNLINAIKYIKKNKITQKDYDDVIAKTSSKQYVLSQKDMSNIFDSILNNCSDANKVTYKNAMKVWKYLMKIIKDALMHFKNIRIWHIGTLLMEHSKGGKYYSPTKGKTEKKAPYDHVRFRPSSIVKRDVVHASKNSK